MLREDTECLLAERDGNSNENHREWETVELRVVASGGGGGGGVEEARRLLPVSVGRLKGTGSSRLPCKRRPLRGYDGVLRRLESSRDKHDRLLLRWWVTRGSFDGWMGSSIGF